MALQTDLVSFFFDIRSADRSRPVPPSQKQAGRMPRHISSQFRARLQHICRGLNPKVARSGIAVAKKLRFFAGKMGNPGKVLQIRAVRVVDALFPCTAAPPTVASERLIRGPSAVLCPVHKGGLDSSLGLQSSGRAGEPERPLEFHRFWSTCRGQIARRGADHRSPPCRGRQDQATRFGRQPEMGRRPSVSNRISVVMRLTR